MKRKQGSPSALGVVLFAMQCAQRIGQWLTLLYIAHVLSTEIALMINPALQAPLQSVLDSCQPTYRLGIGAYFGKAAAENVLKIWNSVKGLGATTVTTSSSSEDSNG